MGKLHELAEGAVQAIDLAKLWEDTMAAAMDPPHCGRGTLSPF